MDTEDGSDEDELRHEQQTDGHSLNVEDLASRRDRNYSISAPQQSAQGNVTAQQKKGNRLRRNFNDQYLELFRSTFEPERNKGNSHDLATSQLGAVTWCPDEKEKLYEALCRKGRHDLDYLTTAIGSKSVVEIRTYLDQLREQEADRQLFEAQHQNISHADIPAAVEIGPECEVVLDRVADALLAFQEQYDFASGQQSDQLWLIDRAIAEELDQNSDNAELMDLDDHESRYQHLSATSHQATTFFHLSTFLDLSERLFMTGGPDDRPESWYSVAEQGQTPCLTLDSITSMYDLVVSFMRRVLQSCLFVAQSRLRACTTRDYRPSGTVKLRDVEAALAVLGIKRNTEAYWTGLARKNGWNVIDDAHRSGVDSTMALPFSEVEERLLQRSRSRSISRTPAPLAEENASSDDSMASSDDTDSTNGAEEEESNEEDDELTTKEIVRSIEDGEGDSTDVGLPDVNPTTAAVTIMTPRHKRLRILEGEQDEYLEKIDQQSTRLEEARLLTLLGSDEEEKYKVEEPGDLGPRPVQPRKSVEDCMGWYFRYEAEWESQAKRRRVDLDDAHG